MATHRLPNKASGPVVFHWSASDVTCVPRVMSKCITSATGFVSAGHPLRIVTARGACAPSTYIVHWWGKNDECPPQSSPFNAIRIDFVAALCSLISFPLRHVFLLLFAFFQNIQSKFSLEILLIWLRVIETSSFLRGMFDSLKQLISKRL